MKNALIDPQDSVANTTIYARVAQVSDDTFSVAEPLFWVACADDVVADHWYFNMANRTFYKLPIQKQPNVSGAQTF